MQIITMKSYPSIKDGALIFHHIAREEEVPPNTCHWIFIECLRCCHTSIGVYWSILISVVITIVMNDHDSSQVINYRSIAFSKFRSKHRMQRNSLNWIFKKLRHQEQMILSSNMYEKTYLQVPLKEFLKLFKYLASSSILMVSVWLDLLFEALHHERKRRKERIPTRLAWAPSVVVVLPLFIDIWNEVFS